MNYINYKFENIASTLAHTSLFRNGIGNFLKHNIVKNKGGNFRYRSSHVVESFFYHDENNNEQEYTGRIFPSYSVEPSHYIISVGVADEPGTWTGKEVNWPYSIFQFINPVYLSDLQNNKALLLIDQSLEGYHKSWLWEWFHSECIKYNINPSSIIYSTGNQAAADQYNEWHTLSRCSANKLKIIPSIALSMPVYKFYQENHLDIHFSNILQYKQKNIQNILLYDCINFKFRKHRIINFLHLVHNNLLSDGKISMGAKNSWPEITNRELFMSRLPLTIMSKVPDGAMWIKGDPALQNFGNIIPRILNELYSNTWVSLVTESSFYQNEDTVFISEKTFKPIACMQPFIIVGSKGVLKYLRKIGYKTFDGFIDESYDQCDDRTRYLAIIAALKKIQNIKDKVAWYESMKDVLEHNHKVFLSIGNSRSIEHKEIIKYYTNYFKDSDV